MKRLWLWVLVLVMLAACGKPAEPEDPRIPMTPSPKVEVPADEDAGNTGRQGAD